MANESNRDIVLLLTHSGDFFTIDRVAEALGRKGVRPLRFNTDLFPLEVKLSARLSPDGMQHILNIEGEQINANQVRAVWARKIWTPKMDESLAPQFHEMCVRESFAAMYGFLDCFPSALWINDPQRSQEAENKLRQLRVAAEVGLAIPRTLTTNDPDQARAFFNELGGKMVAKLMRPLSVSMGQAPLFVYTSDVEEADLSDAEMLRHSPMIFQERISKDIELRLAYVDGNCFAGAIDASLSLKGQTDWRLSTPGECAWFASEVPKEIAGKLEIFMREMGLAYGAIDMIRTSEGKHIFLEVNPGGEWGMLERDLGYPISEHLADALLKPAGD